MKNPFSHIPDYLFFFSVLIFTLFPHLQTFASSANRFHSNLAPLTNIIETPTTPDKIIFQNETFAIYQFIENSSKGIPFNVYEIRLLANNIAYRVSESGATLYSHKHENKELLFNQGTFDQTGGSMILGPQTGRTRLPEENGTENTIVLPDGRKSILENIPTEKRDGFNNLYGGFLRYQKWEMLQANIKEGWPEITFKFSLGAQENKNLFDIYGNLDFYVTYRFIHNNWTATALVSGEGYFHLGFHPWKEVTPETLIFLPVTQKYPQTSEGIIYEQAISIPEENAFHWKTIKDISAHDHTFTGLTRNALRKANAYLYNPDNGQITVFSQDELFSHLHFVTRETNGKIQQISIEPLTGAPNFNLHFLEVSGTEPLQVKPGASITGSITVSTSPQMTIEEALEYRRLGVKINETEEYIKLYLQLPMDIPGLLTRKEVRETIEVRNIRLPENSLTAA